MPSNPFTTSQKIELLAPAGTPEKLEIAIHYGADAVYLAGKAFSLRNFSGNFTPEEMAEAVRFAHGRNVRVYVACNIYSRNDEQNAIGDYLAQVAGMGPDALIVADPAVFVIAREAAPTIPIHISTQASTTNYNAARFWKSLGAARVNVARELTLAEIREIAEKGGVEVEAFGHGAMCISYSGRCLLSGFMAQRDSNRGLCCQPCRFNYAVVEEKRPGQYYPLMEDDRGSYVFNSRDLCMIEHLPEMIGAGIRSLKIEGRMKGINYVASVVKTYREAIDAFYTAPEAWTVKQAWLDELGRVGHRDYCTGFYFGDPEQVLPNFRQCVYNTPYRFVGKVLEKLEDGRIRIDVRNKIEAGDEVEVLSPDKPLIRDTVLALFDDNDAPVSLSQPNTTARLRLNRSLQPNDIVRKTITLPEDSDEALLRR